MEKLNDIKCIINEKDWYIDGKNMTYLLSARSGRQKITYLPSTLPVADGS
jgi:hypothetical protein